MYPLYVATRPEEPTPETPSETPFVLDPLDYQAHQALTLSIMKAYAAYGERHGHLLSTDEAVCMTTKAIQLANEIFKEYEEMHSSTPKKGKYTLSDEEHQYDLAVYLRHRTFTLQLIAQHIYIRLSMNAPLEHTIAKMVNQHSQVAHKTLSTYNRAHPTPGNSIPVFDF